MLKPNMLHVNAIVRAEFYLDGAISKVPEPRMRKQLEDDLLRLAELKLYLMDIMCQSCTLYKDKPEP